MYFHLIWIKEQNWEKYDLDFLLQWWDEALIRDFLLHRWVVVVSIVEFKDDPKSFWNITFCVSHNGNQIQLLMNWDSLEDKVYFLMFLWLIPIVANYVDNPISDEKMNQIIKSVSEKIAEEKEEIRQKKERKELEEQKKYEESWIKDWLRIINENIVSIEQVIKAGEWIIVWRELKQLEDSLNEMKKIRLWTNFNKMASLILDAHVLVENAEDQILKVSDSKKFMIDDNSSNTNIDVFSEYFKSKRISEKAKLDPTSLTVAENVSNIAWWSSVLFGLLWRDISNSFNDFSFGELFDIIINLIESIVLIIIMVITLSWLASSLFWFGNFSLYLLPAMWRLWFLVYLLNNVELKWNTSRILWFIILVLVYRKWLILLLNTFAL